MADLTEATAVSLDELSKWYEMNETLKKLKGTEAMLRRRIADFFFPEPTEGSKDNKHSLNDGSGAVLQMTHSINRTVDEAELEALREAMFADGSNLPQLPLDQIIRWKPELNKAEYNKLTAEEKQVIDRALIVKPGMPSIEIKIPKRT